MIDRDTVIALAKQAGMNAATSPKAVNAIFNTVPVIWLEKFAGFVVEAAEAEKKLAVLAEREACAQVGMLEAINGIEVSAAIRARGTGGER